MTTLDTLRDRLVAAQLDALRVSRQGGNESSKAFDSGRYDGLKQALEMLDDLGQGQGES